MNTLFLVILVGIVCLLLVLILWKLVQWSQNNSAKTADSADRRREINTHHERAWFYRKHGNYNEAMTEIDQAISLGANDYDTYMIRGRIQSEQGNWENAVKDFEKAEILAVENISKHGGGAASNPAYDISVEANYYAKAHRVALELRHKGLRVQLENCNPNEMGSANIRIFVEDENGQRQDVDWFHQ